MFGHDDDQPSTDASTIQPTQPQAGDPPADGSLTADNASDTAAPVSAPDGTVTGAAPIVEPTEEHVEEPVSAEPVAPAEPETPEAPEASVATPSPSFDADSGLSSEEDSTPASTPPTPEPAAEETPEIDLPAPTAESTPPDLTTDPTPAPAADTDPEDLLTIKQEALQQLSPLVSHLDQTPEEKFHTTMMMIQASDDQSLIETAFEAAKEITDDKARAQALLDIINEINYFTQHQSTEQ